MGHPSSSHRPDPESISQLRFPRTFPLLHPGICGLQFEATGGSSSRKPPSLSPRVRGHSHPSGLCLGWWKGRLLADRTSGHVGPACMPLLMPAFELCALQTGCCCPDPLVRSHPGLSRCSHGHHPACGVVEQSGRGILPSWNHLDSETQGGFAGLMVLYSLNFILCSSEAANVMKCQSEDPLFLSSSFQGILWTKLGQSKTNL